MAEAEFSSDAEASSLVIPSFVYEEVTDDSRFTGGSLVATPARRAAQVARGLRNNP